MTTIIIQAFADGLIILTETTVKIVMACQSSDEVEAFLMVISTVLSSAQLIVVSMISYSAHKERKIQEHGLYNNACAFVTVRFS